MIKIQETRTVEHTCDRCGQWTNRTLNEVEDITLPPGWHLLTRANNSVAFDFHLCNGCTTAFSFWLKQI